MNEPRDHFIAAWVARYGVEPTASQLRQGLDRMPAYIRELTSAGYCYRHPEYARPPKARNFEPITDPDPERG